MKWNGTERNGVEWNGMEWNGMEWNGIGWNGMEWNARGRPSPEESKRNNDRIGARVAIIECRRGTRRGACVASAILGHLLLCARARPLCSLLSALREEGHAEAEAKREREGKALSLPADLREEARAQSVARRAGEPLDGLQELERRVPQRLKRAIMHRKQNQNQDQDQNQNQNQKNRSTEERG